MISEKSHRVRDDSQLIKGILKAQNEGFGISKNPRTSNGSNRQKKSKDFLKKSYDNRSSPNHNKIIQHSSENSPNKIQPQDDQNIAQFSDYKEDYNQRNSQQFLSAFNKTEGNSVQTQDIHYQNILMPKQSTPNTSNKKNKFEKQDLISEDVSIPPSIQQSMQRRNKILTRKKNNSLDQKNANF